MSYSLIFPESYEKIERRFLKRHPDLRERYHKTLAILEQDPFHPSLRLHALEGRLAGLHAVSINLQYRITLELELREQEIILISVGIHSEVY
jgi:mRNA-degrading endonuclease YafQ of YafQ-DinJ toxin-antitoxin module